MLISAGHARHAYLPERDHAVTLRAQVSAVSLRVEFEHVLRDRMAWRAA